MKRSSRVLRLVEIALCMAGIVLLGFVLGESLLRWDYQAQQERAFERGPAVSVVQPEMPASGAPHPSPLPEGERGLVEVSPVARVEAPAPAPKIRKKHVTPAVDPTALGASRFRASA